MRKPARRGGTSPYPGLSVLLARLRDLPQGRRTARVLAIFAQPLSGVLLIHGALVGLPLWLVVAQDLRRVEFAVLGLLVGEAARRFLAQEDRPGSEGCLKVNALLTTFAVAWLLPNEGVSIGAQVALVVIMAAIATMLAAALIRALEGTDLPPLVWGYCAVAGALFMILPEWATAAAVDWGAAPSGAADWLLAFFRSLGAFLFAPEIGAGLVIAAVILLWSRTMFLAGVVAWITGVATALMLTDLGVAFVWLPTAYNFFIAGMALGSVYFLPGWTSLAVAALAGCLAAFIAVGLQHLMQFSAASFLPVPLLLTVWVGIGALQSAAKRGQLLRNRFPTIRPEDAWWRAAIDIAKWGRGENLLAIPVEGEVEITQGFSGRLTHAGRWRHALDFERPVSKAHPHGAIFGAPVLAPAPGVIERVQNAVPDNPTGASNYADNWGNYVVIGLDIGGRALLAHLRQGSVTVPVGARVGYGAVLGAVGNSGRSPVPHLHLQVQKGPEVGEATLPFRLANYLYADRPGEALMNWAAAAVPAEGSRLKAAPPVAQVHRLLAGMPSGRALWSVEAEGEIPREFQPAGGSTSLRVEVSLDSAGRQVFAARGGGVLAARFDIDAWRVVEVDAASSFLRLLSLALPSVPYAAVKGLGWADIAVARPGSALGWLQHSLLPYRAAPLVTLQSRCEGAPSGPDDMLTIETRPAKTHPRLPVNLRCQLRAGEGLTSLTAEFAHGSLTYALYSFKPSLPQAVDFKAT